MNTIYINSIFLSVVGLLTMPHFVFALAGGAARIQEVQERDQTTQSSEEEQDLADPLSSGFFNPDPNSVFLSPNREFVRPLVRAIRVHNEGDDNDAAELIGQFLADVGDEDFLISTDKAKGTAVSICRVATEMLGSLPKSAIDTYRVRFGVPARQRLSLAIAESNYFEISQVVQRFPYTDAGIEAAILMGHYHFDAGRALLAADSFQTALDIGKFNGATDPQLSVLTAVSWALARYPEFAELAMRDLASSNGGKFRLGDQEFVIDDADPLAAIKTFIGSGPLESSSKVDQWLLVGGNTRRNVKTNDGFPLGEPVWQVDVTPSQAARKEIETTREAVVGDISPTAVGSLVPANVPLVVDGLVLVGNEKQVSAVDFKTGKRVWAVAAGVDGDAAVKKQWLPQQRAFQGRLQRRATKVLDRDPWTDFLQGHSSSDGKFIYHVVKSVVMPADLETRNLRFGIRRDVEKTANTLQAIDVKKQGELAWEVGGGKTTGDPRLIDVSFLGAPLPIDGMLYAIGKQVQEVVLVALDAKDGKLVWLQSLASAEDTTRRNLRAANEQPDHSLTPSYSEGILVCPTGKNALVAVDTIGRRVLWGSQTGGNDIARSRRSSGGLMKSLQNPQVFLENSRAVAFDVSDDSRLLAVSLLDGSPLMKIGKAGVKVDNVLHVASVDESQVVLVEKTRVRAISTDSGRKLWETSIRTYGPPTGRGYVSEEALYLPTEGDAIIKISLKTGDILDGMKTDQPLGNLILHGGRVISRRETSVSCYELDLKVIAEINKAVEADGGIEKVSPALKVKQAALLRSKGKIKQAIQLLRTIDENGRDGRFKTEFLQSATLLFESDPEYALTLFKEYEDWFQFETNPKMFLGYVELLVKYGMDDDVIMQLFKGDSFFGQIESEVDETLLARPIAGYDVGINDSEDDQDSGESEQAQSNMSKPSEQTDKANKTDQKDASEKKQTDKEVPAFLKNQAEFDKSRISFNQNQWAKAQLIRAARNSPNSIPQIKAAIKQRIELAGVDGVLERHRFLRQFPLEFVAPELRFELAQQLIAKDHVAEAENMFASVLGFLPTSAEQIRTAEVSVNGLSEDSFVKLWSKIRDAQYGNPVEVAAESETEQLAASLDYNCVDVELIEGSSQYQRYFPTIVQPHGTGAKRMFGDKRLSIWGGVQVLEIFGATGESETRFELFEEGMNRRLDMSKGSGWIQANHSLAIMRHNDVVIAIDASKLNLGQPSVIWTKIVPALAWQPQIKAEFDLIASPALRPEDVTASFPSTGCCCFIEKERLVCVDAFSGQTLWARTRDADDVSVLANGNEVVTLDSKLDRSSVFDLRTGERLRTLPVSSSIEFLWDVSGTSFMAVGNVESESLDELIDFQDFRSIDTDAKDKQDGEPEVDKENEDKKPGEKQAEAKKAGVKSGKKSAHQPQTNATTSRVLARYDASTGEFVWTKVFDGTDVFCRLSGDRFAVLPKDNHLYIFEAKTGKELAKIPSGLTETQRDRVQYIGAYEHLGKDLIVMANSQLVGFSNVYRYQNLDKRFPFIYGHLMLISQDKLEPVWDQLAEIDGFQIYPLLPAASPLLILNRKISSSTNTRNPNHIKPLGMPNIPKNGLQLLALDMRNGRAVANEVIQFLSTVRLTSPFVDLPAGKIDLNLSRQSVQLTLETSSDNPPSPTASVIKTNPLPQVFEILEEADEVEESKFDIEELNKRLVLQAEKYEASLTEKRKKEKALLEKKSNQ